MHRAINKWIEPMNNTLAESIRVCILLWQEIENILWRLCKIQQLRSLNPVGLDRSKLLGKGSPFDLQMFKVMTDPSKDTYNSDVIDHINPKVVMWPDFGCLATSLHLQHLVQITWPLFIIISLEISIYFWFLAKIPNSKGWICFNNQLCLLSHRCVCLMTPTFT